MIVLHSFFWKSHPHYLDRAVDMMRNMDGCGFFDHGDFETFVSLLRQELRETTGGRYDDGNISLFRSNRQLQITVKHGLDYVARIYYINVERTYTYEASSRERILAFELAPNGDLRFVNKKSPMLMK